MKKVDKAFIESLPALPARGRRSELMVMAKNITVGESMWISKEEWAVAGYKCSPHELVGSSSYQPRASIFGKRFSGRKYETGWLITRVK